MKPYQNILLIGIGLLFFCSCADKRVYLHSPNETFGFGEKEASEFAWEGITAYLIVPIDNDKLALTTNFSLCSSLIEGTFNGIECSEAIQYFFKERKELKISQIVDASEYSMIDIELLNIFRSQGASFLINQMYDENCILVDQSVLSHTVTQAAALISMGIPLIRTDSHNFVIRLNDCRKD
jgi:hypothetical protein